MRKMQAMVDCQALKRPQTQHLPHSSRLGSPSARSPCGELEYAAEACLARSHRAAEHEWARDAREHALGWRVQDRGLALAGALPRERASLGSFATRNGQRGSRRSAQRWRRASWP